MNYMWQDAAAAVKARDAKRNPFIWHNLPDPCAAAAAAGH